MKVFLVNKRHSFQLCVFFIKIVKQQIIFSSQHVLEDKQDLLEAKFDSLMLELEEYKSAAKTLGAKNREIDDLKAKVKHLEAVLAVRNGVKVTGDALATSGVTSEKSVEERLRDWDRDMRKVKSDLGELMVVYDDLQVSRSRSTSRSLYEFCEFARMNKWKLHSLKFCSYR